jgi:hypothetical protein
MPTIDTSYYFLSIGCAISTVVFLFLSGWPLSKHQESSKLALWASGVAFMHSFMGSMLLKEWGWQLRDDSVEYNYMRGIVFAISAILVASQSASLLWMETTLGWALLLFGGLSMAGLVGMGLSTGAAIWWALSVAVLVPGITAIVIKFGYNQAFHSKLKTQGQRILSWIYAIAGVVIFGLFGLNQVLAPEGSNSYDTNVREWFNMILSFGILLVMLLGYFIYEPVPAALIKESYGPIPGEAVGQEGEKPEGKNS